MCRVTSTESFINKASVIHNNKYDYSLSNYQNSHFKIKIICPTHGMFEQIPNDHLRGCGCLLCCGKKVFDTKSFISKASIIHNNKYDYSLVEYKNSNAKIKITCPIHGIFEQVAITHLTNHGCPGCGKEKVKTVNSSTLKEFTNRANLTHQNKYDYSLVEYKNANTKVKIICPTHGAFEQTPSSHLNKIGCSKCSGNKKRTTEEFIIKSNIIHNNKYDYSLTKYINNGIKVKITCPIHGIFEQIPRDHIRGVGCAKCAYETKAAKRTFSTEKFIEKANAIHNNKYDYSLVEYKKSNTKVKIICLIHGVFEQTPQAHLNNEQGCSKCGTDRAAFSHTYSLQEFLLKANKTHGCKYDYSLVNYTNSNSKIKIICKKHGIFKQNPSSHLNGIGCPNCNSSKGEMLVKKCLDENKINYIQQYKFKDCKFKRSLPFDFYLPELNICIEYDGYQHFKPVKYFGGEESFKTIKISDKIKTEYCKINNIQLIRISYFELNKIKDIIEEFIFKINLDK